MTDFSLDQYKLLCQEIAKNYQTTTFSEYIEGKGGESFMILRHDIDRLASHALSVAQVEHEHNIKATYYFRIPGTFDQKIIQAIADLGHEIGYHYESLDQAEGNFDQAIENFEANLAKLRKIYPVKTVCMHGNPLTRFDNRNLWQKFDYKKYGLIGETYLSLGPDVAYFSDTGRTWSNRFKVKDFPVNADGRFNNIEAKTTEDIIQLIQSKKTSKICLVTHPERWSRNWFEFISYWLLDKLVQIVKSIDNKKHDRNTQSKS